MSGRRKRSAAREAIAVLVPGFAITQEQIDAAMEPGASTAGMFGPAAQPRAIRVRPWHVWRNDPDLGAG